MLGVYPQSYLPVPLEAIGVVLFTIAAMVLLLPSPVWADGTAGASTCT